VLCNPFLLESFICRISLLCRLTKLATLAVGVISLPRVRLSKLRLQASAPPHQLDSFSPIISQRHNDRLLLYYIESFQFSQKISPRCSQLSMPGLSNDMEFVVASNRVIFELQPEYSTSANVNVTLPNGDRPAPVLAVLASITDAHRIGYALPACDYSTRRPCSWRSL
jgi:hypothetical protein